jgi:hypothetical protein
MATPLHVPISSAAMRRDLLKKVMVVGLALLAGCGGDDPTRYRSIAGRYTLRSVNGSPVPYFDLRGGSEIGSEYIDGFFDLNADGSWGEQLHTFYYVGSNPVRPYTTTTTGTFALDGSTITISGPGDVARKGTVDGSTLTVSDYTVRVYTK